MEKITLDHIEKMLHDYTEDVMPAELSVWRTWLGGEFGMIERELNRLEIVKNARLKYLKEQINPKTNKHPSDPQCKAQFYSEPDGIEYLQTTSYMKRLKNAMGTIGKRMRYKEFEASNTM